MTTTGSFAKMATVTASTARRGARVGGVSGDFVVNIATLKCLPLDPLTPDWVSPTIAPRPAVGSHMKLLQTMCEGGLDIVEGDQFIAGGITYLVRSSEAWRWRPSASDTLRLVVEQDK